MPPLKVFVKIIGKQCNHKHNTKSKVAENTISAAFCFSVFENLRSIYDITKNHICHTRTNPKKPAHNIEALFILGTFTFDTHRDLEDTETSQDSSDDGRFYSRYTNYFQRIVASGSAELINNQEAKLLKDVQLRRYVRDTLITGCVMLNTDLCNELVQACIHNR